MENTNNMGSSTLFNGLSASYLLPRIKEIKTDLFSQQDIIYERGADKKLKDYCASLMQAICEIEAYYKAKEQVEQMKLNTNKQV